MQWVYATSSPTTSSPTTSSICTYLTAKHPHPTPIPPHPTPIPSMSSTTIHIQSRCKQPEYTPRRPTHTNTHTNSHRPLAHAQGWNPGALPICSPDLIIHPNPKLPCVKSSPHGGGTRQGPREPTRQPRAPTRQPRARAGLVRRDPSVGDGQPHLAFLLRSLASFLPAPGVYSSLAH